MTEEWDLTTFGQASVNHDARRIPVKKSDRHWGPYPYYGASGVVDHVDGYLFDGEYLLVAEDGENLNTRSTPVAFLADGKFWVNNHAHIITGNNRARTRFLLYAVLDADIDGFITGSAQPKLTQGNLQRLPVFLPPLEVQDAIVEVLGAFDNKIAQNWRLVTILRQTVSGLFKAVCLDYDTTAPLPIRSEAISGLLRRVALDATTLVDSAAGQIPAGWTIGTLETLTDLQRELVNPSKSPDLVFSHFSIPAFDDGETPRMELGITIRSGKYVVPPQSILVSKLNPRIPRVWLPEVGSTSAAVSSTEFMVLVPRRGSDRAFLYAFLISQDFSERFTSLVTGTSGSHQRVKPQDLVGMQVICPPEDLREQLSKVLNPFLTRMSAAIEEARALAEMRNELIGPLLSGELHPTAVGEAA